jgi:DNA-binding transcriptional regulator YhcF (GntR family)
MTANYWIKLYHEVLYDPKMAKMPDHLYRRTIELFLLAGETDKDGALPSVSDMAWKLRIEKEQLETELVELQRTGIISMVNGGYFVTKFADRQDAATPAERKRYQRDRDRKEQYYSHDDVTIRETDKIRIDKIREEENVTEQPVLNLLETIVGFPATPQDLPGIDELTKLNVQEADIRGALQWRKDNGHGPVKRLSQLFAGIKVEYSRRVQDGNARGNGNMTAIPLTLEEENALIIKKAGYA